MKKSLISWFQSDKNITEKKFLYYNGFHLDWKHPQTYNEKLQVIKHEPKSEKLWIYVDKYEVRKYVKKTIGQKYLNQLFNVYSHPHQINFETLPHKFVLKVTHGSGMNIICRDKNQLNITNTVKQLNDWLHLNFYHQTQEKMYRRIVPQIISEKYLEDKNGQLTEYKFFCFNGKVKFAQVVFERTTDHPEINFYTPNWELMPVRVSAPTCHQRQPKPANWNQLLEIAEKLGAPFDHVRVDLYSPDEKIIFSELTFTPVSGMSKFNPPKYDLIFGHYLNL